MIIYFSGTMRDIKRDAPVYKRILRAMRAQGHLIAYDWVETALLREARGEKAIFKRDGFAEIEGAIEGAELLVAEASDGSAFGVGYEVSLALQKRKPVLILVRSESIETSYAAGIVNELATVRTYDEDNLDKVVEDFLNENTIAKKDLRFNFVIDRQLHNHLRLQSFKTGKTKAEVVRDLLLKDMEAKT